MTLVAMLGGRCSSAAAGTEMIRFSLNDPMLPTAPRPFK